MVWLRAIGSAVVAAVSLSLMGACPAQAQSAPETAQDAEALNRQGLALQRQGKYREAEPLFRRALDIWRATLGEADRNTATGYNNVASILIVQGQYGEAEPLLRKALEIRRAVLGENHSDTATSYNSVAYNLNAQGRFGLDEPGLVFTPPKMASVEDDGILTASEASQLSLVADWVILSACNTASTASGAGGSDSLSALSRGFLYAGAHALLASHWQVSDEATAALTVEMLTARSRTPKLTRAQALQQSMHSVRTGKRPDGSAVKGWDQSWAHPSAWAPFSHIANSDE